MRYDWDRRGPGNATFSRAVNVVAAVIAAAAWLVCLRLAFTVGPAELLTPVPLTAAVILGRVALRRRCGVREPRRITPSPRELAECLRRVKAEERAERAAFIASQAGERRQRQARALGLFDTTAVLGPDGSYDGAFAVERAQPDQDAAANEGVIRVTAKRTERGPATGNQPVVTHWSVTARAGTAGEAWALLHAAEGQLPALLADRAAGDHATRYFRIAGGWLFSLDTGEISPAGGFRFDGPVTFTPCQASGGAMPSALPGARLAAPSPSCAHAGAEPVDLLTGERVAWVCPACDAELPADWRQAVDDREWDEALGLGRWEKSPLARDALGMRVTVTRNGEEAVYRVEDVEFGEDGSEEYTLRRADPG